MIGTWFLSILSVTVFQASAATYQPGVYFYRSPSSPFPSGQASMADLEKTKRGDDVQNFYLVEKDGKTHKLEAKVVLRDLDLCTVVLNSKTNQIEKVLQSRAPWYFTQNKKGEKAWRISEDLIPVNEDLGLAYVFSTHPFRKENSWKSLSERKAAEGEKYRVLGFRDELIWVESLESSGLRGYLDPSQVILKHDFASFALMKDKTWLPVASRQGTQFHFRDKSIQNLSSVNAFMTRPDLGILNENFPEQRLVPRSTVNLKQNEWIEWVWSEIKGHGPVYWKKNSRVLSNSQGSDQILTEEILSKPIFSVAFHPKNPLEALVSAQGVYWTKDGKTWTELKQFQKKNMPVAFSADGRLFVGNFASKEGASFHPYLRLEDLTKIFEDRHQKIPGHLTVSELKLKENNLIEIQVNAGGWKASLMGNIKFGLVTDWKVIAWN